MRASAPSPGVTAIFLQNCRGQERNPAKTLLPPVLKRGASAKTAKDSLAPRCFVGYPQYNKAVLSLTLQYTKPHDYEKAFIYNRLHCRHPGFVFGFMLKATVSKGVDNRRSCRCLPESKTPLRDEKIIRSSSIETFNFTPL